MCEICGCGNPESEVKIIKLGEENLQHTHSHGDEEHSREHSHEYSHTHTHTHGGEEHSHEHSHQYSHTHTHSGEHDHEHSFDHEHPEHHHDNHDHFHDRRVAVEKDIMSQNNLLAERNRGYFEAKGIRAINLVSSPGSGKTRLLERTIQELKNEINFCIIEGDQQTMNDANRIHKTGVPVVQINTGEGCHLDADMINKAIKKLEPTDHSFLMVENVGNLVCPALFDLGESYRVVIMSVTEGDDKPIKYPYMFRTSDLCIINKTDLLPYVDFDMEKAKGYAKQINPELEILEVSVKTGEGMEEWYSWLQGKRQTDIS